MKEWVRAPELDTRIRRGDDYASDAWRNTRTGEIKRTVVGHMPNDWIKRHFREQFETPIGTLNPVIFLIQNGTPILVFPEDPGGDTQSMTMLHMGSDHLEIITAENAAKYPVATAEEYAPFKKWLRDEFGVNLIHVVSEITEEHARVRQNKEYQIAHRYTHGT